MLCNTGTPAAQDEGKSGESESKSGEGKRTEKPHKSNQHIPVQTIEDENAYVGEWQVPSRKKKPGEPSAHDGVVNEATESAKRPKGQSLKKGGGEGITYLRQDNNEGKPQRRLAEGKRAPTSQQHKGMAKRGWENVAQLQSQPQPTKPNSDNRPQHNQQEENTSTQLPQQQIIEKACNANPPPVSVLKEEPNEVGREKKGKGKKDNHNADKDEWRDPRFPPTWGLAPSDFTDNSFSFLEDIREAEERYRKKTGGERSTDSTSPTQTDLLNGYLLQSFYKNITAVDEAGNEINNNNNNNTSSRHNTSPSSGGGRERDLGDLERIKNLRFEEVLADRSWYRNDRDFQVDLLVALYAHVERRFDALQDQIVALAKTTPKEEI